jgi:hypothetical protein
MQLSERPRSQRASAPAWVRHSGNVLTRVNRASQQGATLRNERARASVRLARSVLVPSGRERRCRRRARSEGEGSSALVRAAYDVLAGAVVVARRELGDQRAAGVALGDPQRELGGQSLAAALAADHGAAPGHEPHGGAAGARSARVLIEHDPSDRFAAVLESQRDPVEPFPGRAGASGPASSARCGQAGRSACEGRALTCRPRRRGRAGSWRSRRACVSVGLGDLCCGRQAGGASHGWKSPVRAGMISQVSTTTISTLSMSDRRTGRQDASVGPGVARIAATTPYAPAQVSSTSLWRGGPAGCGARFRSAGPGSAGISARERGPGSCCCQRVVSCLTCGYIQVSWLLVAMVSAGALHRVGESDARRRPRGWGGSVAARRPLRVRRQPERACSATGCGREKPRSSIGGRASAGAPAT